MVVPTQKTGGTPNYEAAFFDFFYDDMMSGVQKMMASERC